LIQEKRGGGLLVRRVGIGMGIPGYCLYAIDVGDVLVES
jgi:hypothetical protein